jgi:deferrochelatase/peroxidase EfeB
MAAKMVGRWRSGCPLALSPDRDDPEIAKDPLRNDAFGYADDDLKGLKTPAGSHIRRVNPRDALRDSIVNTRLHRIFRRGATYGPMLPEGCWKTTASRAAPSSRSSTRIPGGSSSSSSRKFRRR